MNITKKRIIKNIINRVDKIHNLPAYGQIFSTAKAKSSFYQCMNITRLDFIKTLSIHKNDVLTKVIDFINNNDWESSVVLMASENNYLRKLMINEPALSDFQANCLAAQRKYIGA